MLWTPSILVLLPALAWRLSSNSAVTALDLQSRQAADTTTPSCVQGCIQSLPNNCQTTDACFCDESSVTSAYTSCLQTQCTSSEDRVAGQQFHSQSCNGEQPVRNGETYLIAVTWAYFGLTVIFVALRLVSRWPGLNGSGYDWDDYVIILAFLLLIPLDVSLDQEARLGLGQDMWFINTSGIQSILHWFYASEILYICVVMLTKVAIVLLYLRIWTADSITKSFRLACWIVIGLCITTMLAFVFGTIFQCEPISFAWNYISGGTGSCIQVAPMLYAFAALDIIYNIIVFLLPIPSLRKLQIGWSKKLALSTIFGVGALVTVFSVVRIGFLARSDRESNATWYYHWVGLWSIIEANLSVICVCAPATVGLFQRWMTGGVREADDDWVNGSFTRQMAIRGPLDSDDGSPDVVPTEMSQNGFGDAENAFRQDQEDGRYSESINDKPGDNMSTTDAGSMMSRGRPGGQTEFRSAPGDGTALQYRPQGEGSGTNRVEISHEPPTQPAEAHLSYRDENDIYHEVIVTDIPHGRHGPIHPSRSRMRPSNLRALAEDEVDERSRLNSDPSTHASSNVQSSNYDSTRSSDPQGQGVTLAPQSPPKSPAARSLSPPVSHVTADSIDGGVASGIWSRPKSYSTRPVSQIARTPSLASATIEATEVAAKTPSPPWMSPPASGSSHSIATQTEDTELSPAPSMRPKQQRSQEVLFSPRSLSPPSSEAHYQPLKSPSMGTQTDEEDLPPDRGAHHNSSMNNGIEVSPMMPKGPLPPPSGRWEWPSEPEAGAQDAGLESPRGRSPPPEFAPREPSIESVDRAVQADIPTPEDEKSPVPRPAGYRDSATNMEQDFSRSPEPQDFYPTTRSPSRSPMQSPGVPDQYGNEPLAPFTQMEKVRAPSRSPTRSPVPLTDESYQTTDEVKFRGRSPPRYGGSIAAAPRSASSAALRAPPVLPGRMVDAGNQTDEEDDDFIDDRPQTLSPPHGRDQMPSLSPTVSQLDLPYASRNIEAEMRNRTRSRSPLPNYPYQWQGDESRSRSRAMSGELLPPTTYNVGPPTTYNVGWQRDSPRRSPSGERSPQPMFWDGPAIKEDIGNAFAEQPYQHEANDSREWRSPGPYNRDHNDSREWRSPSPYNREKNDWRSPSPWRNRSPPRFLSPLPGPDYDNMNKGPRTASSQAVPVYRMERDRSMSPTAWQAGVPPEPEYYEYEEPVESPFTNFQKEQQWRPPSPTSLMSGILPDEAHGREYRTSGMSPLREQSGSRSRSRPGMGRRVRSRSLVPSRSPPQERSYSAESVQSQNKGNQTSPDEEYPPLSEMNNRSASVQTDDLPSPPESGDRPTSQEVAVRPHLSPLQPMDRLKTPSSSKEPSPQQTFAQKANDHSNRSPPKSRSPRAGVRSQSVEGGTQTDSDWEDHLEDAVAMDIHDHSDRSPPKSRSPPHQRSTSADAGMQTDSDWEEHLDRALNEARARHEEPKSVFYADNAQSPGFPDVQPLGMRDHSASPAHSPYPLPPHGYELMNDIPVHNGRPMDDGRGRSPAPANEAYPSPHTGIPRMPSIDPAEQFRLDNSPRRSAGGLHDKYMDDEDGYQGDRDATPDDRFRGIAGLRLRSPSGSPQREEDDEDDGRDWQPPRPGQDFDYEIPRIPPELLAQLVDASTSKVWDGERSPSPPRTTDPTLAAMAEASADRALYDERSPSPGMQPSVSSLALPFHREQSRSGSASPNVYERSAGGSGFPSPSAFGHRDPSPGDLAARLAEATKVPESRKASPMPSPQVASPYHEPAAGTPDAEKDALPNWSATPWHDAKSPGDSPLASPDEAEGVSIHRGESYQGPPAEQYTAGTDMNTPGSEFIPTRPVSQMMVPTLAQTMAAATSPRVSAEDEQRSLPASPDMEKGSALEGLVSGSPSPPVERADEGDDDERIASDLNEPRTGDLADNSRSPSILAGKIDRNRDSMASTPGSIETPFESGLFNEDASRSISPPADRVASPAEQSQSESEPSRAASPVEALARILRSPSPQSEPEESFSGPSSPRVEEIGSELQDSPMLARHEELQNVDPANRDDYDSVAPRSPSPVHHQPQFIDSSDHGDYDSAPRSRSRSEQREQLPVVDEEVKTEESESEPEPEPSPAPPQIREAPQSDADDTDIEEDRKDSFPQSSLPFPVRQAMSLLQPNAKSKNVKDSVAKSVRSPSPAKSKYVDQATAITPMEREEPEMPSRPGSDLRLDNLDARSPSPEPGPRYVDSATATTFEEARPEVPPSDWENEVGAADSDARSPSRPTSKYVNEATVAALERPRSASPPADRPQYVDQTTAMTLEEAHPTLATRDLAIDDLYTRSIEENDLPTASLLAESRKSDDVSEVEELPTISALVEQAPEESSQFSKTSSEEESLFSNPSKAETEDSSRPGSYPSARSDSAESGSLPSLSKSQSGSPPHTPEPGEDSSLPVSQLAIPTLNTITESPPAPEPEIKDLDLSPMEQARDDADSRDPETRPTSMYFSPLTTPGVQPSNLPTPKFVSALATPTEEYFPEEAFGTRTPTAESEKFSFPARGLSPAASYLGQRLGSPHPEVDSTQASRGASPLGLELPFSGESPK